MKGGQRENKGGPRAPPPLLQVLIIGGMSRLSQQLKSPARTNRSMRVSLLRMRSGMNLTPAMQSYIVVHVGTVL